MANEPKIDGAKQSVDQDQISRRDFITATGGLLPLSIASVSQAGTRSIGKTLESSLDYPFDSMRDWVAALEAHGLLLRMGDVDQDQYHATGLFYNLTDKFTWSGSPAMLFDRVKIDGEWINGPLLANLQGHLNTDSIIWNLETSPTDHEGNYRRARNLMKKIFSANDDAWPTISPAEVEFEKAPVKEVVLRGDEIDLTRFAFIQTNPADGGRYINSGSMFTEDPEKGKNFGTYRCQLKGPRKIALNPETGQTGYKMIAAARDRGEKSYPVAVVLGQDPVTFMVSSTKVAGFVHKGRLPDELAIAGGLRGKAIDVVKCETNDMLVPAHAEMIIEGEVLFDEPLEPEGPFGEMYGYLGPKDEAKLWMKVNAVTHRKNPWILNMFTGMERGFVEAPFNTFIEHGLKQQFPYITEYYQPHDTSGITYISINKTEAGQGLALGKAVTSFDPVAKITVVLDDDVNLLNQDDVLRAIVARWQPYPAAHIRKKSFGIITDPSQRVKRQTSKIAIDATRQFPEEGGPEVFAGNNRDLLNQLKPNAINDSAVIYSSLLKDWKEV
ncbi:MAG: UbiD family decarboxylase [Pseudomonadota bacterium]|nr:UbiD family decarboxylase [Pseudomonadota bacterium]